MAGWRAFPSFFLEAEKVMVRRLFIPAVAGALLVICGCGKDVKEPTVKDNAGKELKPLPSPASPGGVTGPGAAKGTPGRGGSVPNSQ